MAFDRVGHQSRPLLPDELEARVLGGLKRGMGFGLVALAAAGWLSIMTWSALDPSLTHATSATTRNWLGPIGAIVSDLFLQTIGFAALLPFLCIAWIGLELITTDGTRSLRVRAWLMPAAVLALAAGFSSLPTPAVWPLNHGIGGMLGDVAYGLLSGLLGYVNPARAGAVTGLLMLAVGVTLLGASMNLSPGDLTALVRDPDREPAVRPAIKSFVFAQLGRWIGRSERTDFAPSVQRPAPLPVDAGQAVARDAAMERWPAERREPMLADPRLAAGADTSSPYDANRPESFDHATDIASTEIAKRFAPAVDTAKVPPPPRPGLARVAAEQIGGLMSRRGAETGWRRPSLNLLKMPASARAGGELNQSVLRGNARLLEDVLTNFSVKGVIKDIRPGPVVTLFEFEPARGTKSSRVIALSDDVAREMSATSARIAVVPGRNAMGIELPNARRETVYLRELLDSEAWRASDAHLPVVLGKGIGGEPIIADLARMPHLLVAGTTGSGKSVCVNAMILSLLYRLSPAECRLIMIDPKMLELSVYNDIPHLLAPVVTDPHQAAGTLAWAVMEMEERYKRMSQLGVRNIELFNNRVRNARKRGELAGARTVHTGYDARTGEALYERDEVDYDPMPYIVILVDEFADLMVVAGKEVEGSVQRLAQMARAAGIHLIMATQRPSVDVVTGTIKANFPTRIAFKVASKVDSRTILNDQGAEQLLGAGDMLYSGGSGQIVRVHGPFVSDEEVEKVAVALREAGAPSYVESLIRAAEAGVASTGSGATAGDREPSADGSDELYDRAVAIVHRDQKASTSYLQRRLSIGYNRAADLIERMEKDGLVSAADAVGRRRVLIGQGGAGEAAE